MKSLLLPVLLTVVAMALAFIAGCMDFGMQAAILLILAGSLATVANGVTGSIAYGDGVEDGQEGDE